MADAPVPEPERIPFGEPPKPKRPLPDDDLRTTCFLFHRWGKWGPPKQSLFADHPTQDRTCTRCGRVQRRSV